MAIPLRAPKSFVLLSALTGIPINQSLSMTGAIDQLGHVESHRRRQREN